MKQRLVFLFLSSYLIREKALIGEAGLPRNLFWLNITPIAILVPFIYHGRYIPVIPLPRRYYGRGWGLNEDTKNEVRG